MSEISVFWFRRDLRLQDNKALNKALSSKLKVLCVFIFDNDILNELPEDDARVSFIHDRLRSIDKELKIFGSSLLVLKGKPIDVWKTLLQQYKIKQVYVNKDYEPYARKRDKDIEKLLLEAGSSFISFKDQVIHEENDVLKADGTPYTVFTPYKRKWLELYKSVQPEGLSDSSNFLGDVHDFPTLESIGFKRSLIEVRAYDLSKLNEYQEKRDFPDADITSYLSPHLRFGTISVRQIIEQLGEKDETFLSELIWREFFMQILYHFPKVVTNNFKQKYDGVVWLNNKEDFKKWCEGKTGYPMVDAGMRQLNETGYMHNRVRMITAGFLCKHLLIDWKWGEAYFAKKLLDYDLSANNGNWQWAAGTGCDAAPYFRIFNPIEQLKKFDKNLEYVKQWIPEFGTSDYPLPMVEHKFARKRALETYKVGLEGVNNTSNEQKTLF
ncbi:cryptochrome/photolyase family protein [Seonamhaeicola marinus]|uniref:Deoxyribodipyrimidine photo-lyase n=1 Tax=Seonamhaeicola marinus TaxID=1912246 RepID=A0A5D0HXJ8_9FLAO|nr:deoxyribodipyrimidine photo-lyase [Seonamhaeicola marinus]TYA74877.1 deoxyribodipyrimidine photo-lyase [Seonamhaeicola marinus]